MENNSQELIKIDPAMNTNIAFNKDAFDHIQRVALMFSKSDMVPKRYQGNPGNCIIALEMSSRIGASALMVMQNLDIIMGKPGWSSKFLIATLNACGKFSPLRYEEDEEDGGRTRAWAFDKVNNEKVYGAWVSMKMAEAEGWISKAGSKWKTMPELMKRYRAASFFVNQFAPEISMGLPTSEEIYDIQHEVVGKESLKNISEEKEYGRITDFISSAETPEDLEKLREHLKDDFHFQLFENKEKELKNKK